MEHEILRRRVTLSLAEVARRGTLVVYFYPASEAGARQSLCRRLALNAHRLRKLGTLVVAVSAQTSREQRATSQHGGSMSLLLSDASLRLAYELGLPTSDTGIRLDFRPLTLIVRDERIARVLYPIPSPASHITQLFTWLIDHPTPLIA